MTQEAPSASRPTSSAFSLSFVVGRHRFARISAVEGIVLSRDLQEILKGFDLEGLSADERRRAIVRRFKPAR